MKQLKAGDRIKWKGYEWIVLDTEYQAVGGAGVLLILSKPYWDIKPEAYDEISDNYKMILNWSFPDSIGEDNVLIREYKSDPVFCLTNKEFNFYRNLMPSLDQYYALYPACVVKTSALN